MGNILQQHIVGIPSHRQIGQTYILFWRSLSQTHITSSFPRLCFCEMSAPRPLCPLCPLCPGQPSVASLTFDLLAGVNTGQASHICQLFQITDSGCLIRKKKQKTHAKICTALFSLPQQILLRLTPNKVLQGLSVKSAPS